MEIKELFVKSTGCEFEKADNYLWRAEQFLLNETNRTVLPTRLNSTKLEMAVILFNRDGMEGETSRSEGGINIGIAELPVNIQRAISLNRLARVSGRAFEKTNDATSETES